VKPNAYARPGQIKSPARIATSRPPTAEERRRAQRVLLRMPVHVRVPGKPEPIEAMTHTVSENGALIILREPLVQGNKVLVENPKTQKVVEAQVVRPPQLASEGALVPLEFCTPMPAFWGIYFPPVSNAV
jgi:PilZ domain-containing protein